MVHRRLSSGLLAPHALIDKLNHLSVQTEKRHLMLVVSMNELDHQQKAIPLEQMGSFYL